MSDGAGEFMQSAGGASAISAGTSAAGGLLNAAVFAPMENRANARQAAQMDPFLNVLENINLSDVRGAGQAVQGLSGQIAGMAPEFQRVGQSTARGIGAASRQTASDLRGIAQEMRTSDVTGLEAAARRRLEGQGSALQAQLAARGLASSGAGSRAQTDLLTQGLTDLAQQINADQFARQQARGGLLGQAGQISMQGASQAGAALQAGLAGSQGALQAGMQGQQAAANIFQNATQAEQNAAINAAQLIGSTPGFKNYDRATGRTRGK